MKILICEPDQRVGGYLLEGLSEFGHKAQLALNGREAQSLLSKESYEFVLLNCALSSYSAIEVVKFIRFKNVKARVLVTAKNDNALDDWLMGRQNLKKLGIGLTMTEPVTAEKVDTVVKGFYRREQWRVISQTGTSGEEVEVEVEVEAYDDQFTSIPIDEFFCGNLAIFDLYIRLGRNKYLKILNRGEAMEQERIEKYKNEKGVERLFFLTKERKVFINFMNELVEKTLGKKGLGQNRKVSMVQNLVKLMIQEVYTKGIDNDTLEETVKACDNVQKTIDAVPNLKKALNESLTLEDTSEGHLSLTMIYSDAIARNLDWVGERSRSKILMGALLHDIGKLKLPASLRNKKSSELTGKSLEEYRKHCVYGVELLDQFPEIGEPVKQIALQHHELNNGEGYPFGLTGSRIYPPAKIVAFANKVAELSITMQSSPVEVLKKMVRDRNEILAYEPEVVKAFIKCFTDKGAK